MGQVAACGPRRGGLRLAGSFVAFLACFIVLLLRAVPYGSAGPPAGMMQVALFLVLSCPFWILLPLYRVSRVLARVLDVAWFMAGAGLLFASWTAGTQAHPVLQANGPGWIVLIWGAETVCLAMGLLHKPPVYRPNAWVRATKSAPAFPGAAR